MRLAVLSDVHANRAALEAALAAVERLGADRIVCPGDLVGYGPDPNGSVRTMLACDAVTVAGNHDLIAIGRLDADRCIPLARRSLEWTRAVLDEDVRAALGALPALARPSPEVLVAHGVPGDPQAYVHDGRQAADVFAGLAATHPGVRVLVLGHTHRWMAYAEQRGALPVHPGGEVRLEPAERVLLNAGSVGQSRERTARARFMILDLGAGRATFHAVRYDVRATRRSLRQAGLSPRGTHLYASPVRRAASRAFGAVAARRRAGSP